MLSWVSDYVLGAATTSTLFATTVSALFALVLGSPAYGEETNVVVRVCDRLMLGGVVATTNLATLLLLFRNVFIGFTDTRLQTPHVSGSMDDEQLLEQVRCAVRTQTRKGGDADASASSTQRIVNLAMSLHGYLGEHHERAIGHTARRVLEDSIQRGKQTSQVKRSLSIVNKAVQMVKRERLEAEAREDEAEELEGELDGIFGPSPESKNEAHDIDDFGVLSEITDQAGNDVLSNGLGASETA